MYCVGIRGNFIYLSSITSSHERSPTSINGTNVTGLPCFLLSNGAKKKNGNEQNIAIRFYSHSMTLKTTD